jgi:hypothetical protein
MEQQVFDILIKSGILGAIIFLMGKYGLKVITTMYDDMKTQHNEQLSKAYVREEKLMKYLDGKNESDAKVASTLDNICNEMGCMNRRIEDVEKSVRKEE